MIRKVLSEVAYSDRCIHQLFEERVEKMLDAVALVYEDQQLSYRELNARANQLAHYLKELGIGPETRVGICVERSLEMVIGLLGILKAGGCYVPLDPEYPPARLQYMIEDSGIKNILTQDRVRERVLFKEDVEVILLDRLEREFNRSSRANPKTSITSQNLAYVIYTSGSTGKPKGVMIKHEGLTNFLHAMKFTAERTVSDVLLAITTYGFDIAALELYWPLIKGAKVCIASKDASLDVQILKKTLHDQGITILQATPATWRMLNGSGWLGKPDLTMLCGGEAWDAGLAQSLEKKVKEQWNMYGPTETTIWSAAAKLLPNITAVNISGPINNTQFYILDDDLNPTAIGDAGELYISGVGLARGYLNRPDLTAEKFVPNSFSNKPGERLYRTGDLVRRLVDGSIEFLGRIDHQVKIRGFRIELKEIEHVLLSQPEIREGIVLAQANEDGNKYLIAYFVCSPEKQADSMLSQKSFRLRLRQALKASLPEHMIPSYFVQLENLPLTPNGKVDRNALLPPDLSQLQTGVYVAPESELERLLVSTWAEVLKVPAEKIGIEDNFFELGGQSLLAMQVTARIRDKLKIEFPLKVVFERPMVRELALYLGNERNIAFEIPLLRRVGPHHNRRLSFSQQRLWFLNQYDGGKDVAYNIPWAMRLRGHLDVQLLNRAFDELVRHHESLRTTFNEQGGEPLQVIVPKLNLEIPIFAIEGSQLEERINSHAWHVFDLTEGPLIKVSLLKLSEEEHILLINMHHIISDGWSIAVFVRELSALYGAYVAGQPSPLSELQIQYSDYVYWQREWLQGDVLKNRVKYWEEHLKGAPRLLELPTDRPRPAIKTYHGCSERATFPKKLLARLNALSKTQGVTLFMTLLAAFKVLLYRYSNQSDIVVGTPIANRSRQELEKLIGFFVNTLALRTRLDPDISFERLLQRIKAATLEGYDYQDVPFELLVERLNPERSLSYSPVFQVMFALQNMPFSWMELSGLVVERVQIETIASKFDLSMFCWETGSGLEIEVEFNVDLFERKTIRRLINHYQVLLEGVVADAGRPIFELPLLTQDEYRQIVYEWNDTARDYPGEKCIHQLFEDQVEKIPDAVALGYDDRWLSYRDLNIRANRLAHYLIEQGAGPEVRVGICAERSLEMVIGLLGILKAGGCYVPLDPEYPPARLQYMLVDSGVKTVILQGRLSEVVRFGGEINTVVLDDQTVFDRFPESNPKTRVTSQNLAYVIYTSGSTGLPKGAMNYHGGLMNRLAWMQDEYKLDSSSKVLQKTPFTFDVSVWEFFWPLREGAQLVLASPNSHKDPEYLADIIEQRQVDTLHFVPSMLEAFLSSNPRPLNRLKRVICSGEALPKALVSRFNRWSQSIDLHNLYGPTEASIDVSYWQCDPHYKNDQIPIGRPIDNTQLIILDRQFNPVPVGVSGELYIGGVGLARGYFNRPDLTAEKFVPNPFSSKHGERLYRTGDLARYLPDGNIEFLGRIDHQVKIRGFRIELGEIEHALLSQPGIKEAVVLAHEREGGDKYLVAYVVGLRLSDISGQVKLDLEQLRQALKGSLPDYMVPPFFVELEALPLTPNGKVDRKALLPPDASQIHARAYVAPRTETERQLVSIWAEVLKLPEEKVGIDDNFFALGGHSLLGMQVAVRIRDRLKTGFQLKVLFERPVIRELGLYFEGESTALVGQLPLRPVNRNRSLQLSFAQQRLWFLNQYEGDITYNIPFAMRLWGSLDIEALRQALNSLVLRHESLRTIFIERDGEPLQLIASDCVIPVPMIEIQEPMIKELVQAHARHVFNLSKSPLLKVSVLKLAKEEYVLLISMHHIISDGWSLEVFVREFSALYGACVGGRRDPLLPELPIQYADYAHWQREWLRGEVLERQVRYWERHLEGAPKRLELPTDRPRPAIQSYRGRSERVIFSGALLEELRAFSHSRGVTLFMTLLAAFKVMLYRYTHQTDIVIGTPIANRSRAELEGLVGFFVNTLALRTRLEPEAAFLGLLDRIQATTLDAYDNQDVPFEYLVERLNPERSLSYSPIFQVMFVLQNVPFWQLEFPGLKSEPVPTETVTSKFDLTLSCTEMPAGLRVSIEYNTDMFEAETIRRMLGHYQVLLESILEDPSQSITRLPLLTEREYKQIVHEWNDTEVTYPRDKCIHQLFEEQVERTPEAIAVVCDDHQLSYRELDNRANQLAHYLIEKGGGLEARICVCLEKSPELIVAIFAILKTGGVYIPIASTFSRERVKQIIHISQASIVLNDAEDTQLRSEFPDTKFINVGEIHWGESEIKRPYGPPVPENLAYAIFTSGSTGEPKGVMVSHSALLNMAYSVINRYNFKAGDRVLVTSSISFDSSISQLFPVLTVGGKVILSRSPDVWDIQSFLDLVSKYQLRNFGLSPATLSIVNEMGYKNRHVTTISSGGEQLKYTQVDKISKDIQILNIYGPTETTVSSTVYPIKSVDEGRIAIPIGKPLENYQIYILDPYFNPVPMTVSGELYIGGAGLARGYLNRADLTAEKFLPNPFSEVRGQKLYGTGDLARFLPDGNIEFLGRIDHQVKIRGFRIELGEIEHALLNQPEIKEAVVLAHERDGGDKYLVGYVVPQLLPDKFGQTKLDQGRLRQELKVSLPEYMVPSYFVELEALPLTPNGKVDRKALLPPDASQIQAMAYVAPRTEAERRLVSIWAEVLKLPEEKIGIEDNFFALGGHSLLAMQVAARIRDRLKIEFPLKMLFEFPVIHSLSVRIQELIEDQEIVLSSHDFDEQEILL